ncbi:hypothetical protein PYCCODRAFT_1471351 [Trametes coccinea BRFM310]|uniref:Uncharacterized protein n=1 Tax=Trametes coccinea (strain BRFM310) TaxID=1353009 RepID=A0A1Y2IA27_TRAC3|nr:hypothetical protein PYCCODRAFT_1471351 [Trametes coccinea BRFM310]
MTAQAPQLPLSPSLLAPAMVVFESAQVVKVQRKTRRRSVHLDTHIPNPVQMFDRIVIHPIAWPEEALRWMGVPRRLPSTLPPRSVTLPPATMSAALRKAYDNVAEMLDSGEHVPREDLSNLVVDAFAAIAKVQNVYVYHRAKAYLSLGDMRVRVEPIHGFSASGVAPVLAYLDEPFRRAQRARLMCWRGIHADCHAAHQQEDRVDVMDAVLLLAYAQEHRRWSAPPDAAGNHITRVMYPNTAGDAMIVLTAITPAETLVGIQDGHEILKRIRFSRQAIPIMAQDKEWASSPLLQFIWGLVEEGGKLAVKAPAPRWPIGPWAWTTHF